MVANKEGNTIDPVQVAIQEL